MMTLRDDIPAAADRILFKLVASKRLLLAVMLFIHDTPIREKSSGVLDVSIRLRDAALAVKEGMTKR